MRNFARSAVAIGFMFATLTTPQSPRAADDTFSCLTTYSGPEVDLSGNHSYNRYNNTTWSPSTRFDATAGVWNQEITPRKLQDYPITLREGRVPFCWAGGKIDGTNDINATWCDMKRIANNAGFLVTDAPNFTLDGNRINNVQDGVRIRRSQNWTIKNTWLSYIRDDCIENDDQNSGTIENSLLECHMGISAQTETSRDGSGDTVRIHNSLIHLQSTPGPRLADNSCDRDQTGHAVFFKWSGHSGGGDRRRTPKLEIHDNIFFADTFPSNGKNEQLGIPEGKLTGCSNNVMVWGGPGAYPAPLPSCFTITKDRSVWDRAKANWINCHPKLARVAGDPESDPSKCDRPIETLQVYVSKKAADVPVVDGNLDEFRSAPLITLGEHRAAVLWTPDALYIAVTILDDQVEASITTRDGALWTEDSLEVFIDPEGDRGSRMAGGDRHFSVNARGTQLDSDGEGSAWDGDWRAASSFTLTGYAVELAIPWTTLGITPEAGASYGFSFAVNDQDGSARTQMLWGGAVSGFRVPDKWGTLTISPDPADLLTITSHNVKDVTDKIAFIEWNLSEAADGFVEYGPTPAYGSRTGGETRFLPFHRQRLSDLSPATAYFYRINSNSQTGATASVTGSFNTKPTN
jgi:hypothetical protein